MQYPEWREAPPYIDEVYTFSQLTNDTLARMRTVALQRKHAHIVQAEQLRFGMSVLCPCSWCGLPTGDWCERCHEVEPEAPAAHAICSSCDAKWVHCRLCRLELQVSRREAASNHRSADGAWRGTMRCGACGVQKLKMQQCVNCGVARYCSKRCQSEDWRAHKPFCNFFAQMQPLSLVYPWFAKRAEKATENLPWLYPPVRTHWSRYKTKKHPCGRCQVA